MTDGPRSFAIFKVSFIHRTRDDRTTHDSRLTRATRGPHLVSVRSSVDQDCWWKVAFAVG